MGPIEYQYRVLTDSQSKVGSFTKTGVAEILNLQPKGSKAKSYQVKQVRGVIVKYRLAGESDEK